MSDWLASALSFAVHSVIRAVFSAICSDSLIRSRVTLAFLSPDLQRATLDGTAPSHLTTNLIVRTILPHDWQEQAKALGL